MRFLIEIESEPGGRVRAICREFPGCRAEAVTRDEAIEKIRRAIAYYREMCPCDVTSDAGVELDIVDAARR
ncbi:MAG TPA: hypothetical protein VGR66_00260 [Candidatus Eisenbacteria bacterium]|jgi:predicted RNase H-like HicB family nuclease|nr:hypothetical protein [Candidatus Eisenbacteria bacterium]